MKEENPDCNVLQSPTSMLSFATGKDLDSNGFPRAKSEPLLLPLSSCLPSQEVQKHKKVYTPYLKKPFAHAKKRGMNINFRILGTAGGINIIFTSFVALVQSAIHVNVLGIFIYLYTMVFGVLICILEEHINQWFFQSKPEKMNEFRSAMIEGLPPLNFIWGRGLFIILSGMLQLSHQSIMHASSGSFLVAVGILYIIIDATTRKKIRNLMASFKNQKSFRRSFNRFDRDGDGALDMDEFGAFAANFAGEELNEDDLEGMFVIMDVAGLGRITLENANRWWPRAKIVDKKRWWSRAKIVDEKEVEDHFSYVQDFKY